MRARSTTTWPRSIRTCRALPLGVLDVGSGLGGIDVLLNRHYLGGGSMSRGAARRLDDPPARPRFTPRPTTTWRSPPISSARTASSYLTCYSNHCRRAGDETVRPDHQPAGLVLPLSAGGVSGFVRAAAIRAPC
jgi:hypothetical protein